MKSLNIYSKEQIDEKLSDIEATLPPSTVDDVNKALVVDAEGEPKWTTIGNTLPSSTVDDVNKALIVDFEGEPKWTTIGAEGKIKVTFDSLQRFIGYLATTNLKIGDTLYINCVGSVQALDITAVVNATQIDVSDNEDGTSFNIPCNGVVKNTLISSGEIQSKIEIIYGGTQEYVGGAVDGGIEVGDYNSVMYYSYSNDNSTLAQTGVSTPEIWKADITSFKAVLITTG